MSEQLRFCKGCSKQLKIYVKCFECDSIYHFACFDQQPNRIIAPDNKLYCCKDVTVNITSNNSSNFKNEDVKNDDEIKDVAVTQNKIEKTDSKKQKGVKCVVKKCKRNEDVKVPEKYDCVKCPFSTKWYTSLKQHELLHSVEKKYECLMCGKKLKQHSQLYNHEKMCRSRMKTDLFE